MTQRDKMWEDVEVESLEQYAWLLFESMRCHAEACDGFFMLDICENFPHSYRIIQSAYSSVTRDERLRLNSVFDMAPPMKGQNPDLILVYAHSVDEMEQQVGMMLL